MKTRMNSGLGDKAFTQQWLQSLTLVAREPAAQKIKPLLDTINDLSRVHIETDRMLSAQRLWDFGTSEGLESVLSIMPIQQPGWVFDRDDPFVFERTDREEINDFPTWTKCLGAQEGEVSLTAEVASRDWLTRLRQEAVRLQQSLNTAAVPAGMNLRLGCKAVWDLKGWSIRFDQAEWMVLRYDEPFSVTRPEMAEIDECLAWAIANANDTLQPKVVGKCSVDAIAQAWMKCVPQLVQLHERVLVTEAKHYSTWFRRAWACVWAVMYREQNVLRGQANIDVVRQELAACVKDVPRITTWMFVFAKLVCECQLGRGLGISGDYLA